MVQTSKKSPADRPGALIVAGMHRSGTSALTRMLSLNGAKLPDQLMPAQHDNPRGFWESKGIADLNDEVLGSLGSSWDDVFALRLGREASQFVRFEERATRLIQEEFGRPSLIVLKDPRTSLLMPLWLRALDAAGYASHAVLMVRNPVEVAASLHARDRFPTEKSLLLWCSYMLAAERDTRCCPRSFVTYDQLLDDWRGVRNRIGAAGGIVWGAANSQAEAATDAFLSRDLRHHDLNRSGGAAHAPVPARIGDVGQALVSAAAGQTLDTAILGSAETWLLELGTMMQPLLADLHGRVHLLTSQVVELNDAHGGAREQADRFAGELSAKSARVTKLEKQLAQAQAALDSIEAEVETAIRRVEARTDRKICDAQEQQERWQEQIDAERRRADQREAEAELLTGTTKRLRADLTSAEAKLSRFDQRLDAAEDEFELAMQALERHTDARIVEAEQSREQARKRLSSAEQQLAAVEHESELLRGQVDALSGELRAVRSSLSWRLSAPLRIAAGRSSQER